MIDNKNDATTFHNKFQCLSNLLFVQSNVFSSDFLIKFFMRM